MGAVNITRGDYKRLDDGEFFNDTLIEFGLKCVHPFVLHSLGSVNYNYPCLQVYDQQAEGDKSRPSGLCACVQLFLLQEAELQGVRHLDLCAA